jgi:hypothetical protein
MHSAHPNGRAATTAPSEEPPMITAAVALYLALALAERFLAEHGYTR